MKKIANILLSVFILLLFYLTKDKSTLALTISFSMYMLFYSLFSTTSIKDKLEKYYNNKSYYTVDKIFKYSVIAVLLLGIILTTLAYLIGNILDITNLGIINISMSISLLTLVILKLISEYLYILGYKKISHNLINIYIISSLVIGIILSFLLFKVFNLDDYLNFTLLYVISIIVFIAIIILLYILIIKGKKKNIKTREENKVNYISEIKGTIINNPVRTVFNIIKVSYIYSSIIILYYVLTNKYNYDYETVDTIITSTYFYGMIIVYCIYHFVSKKLDIDYNNIKDNFNSNINKIITITLNLCILLAVLSIPINNLLFASDYNLLIGLIPLLFFYILYDYIININIKITKDKNTIIILLMGLLIKIVFDLPFISSIYRMGYMLTSGPILSIILGLIVSIIMGLIFIQKKLKLNLLDNFTNILNIIYESIIYTLILVIFTLIVKVDRVGTLNNILIIIFYLFISILFSFIKKILAKK